MKSLEADDMSDLFYQKYWHIVSGDLSNYMVHALNNNMLHDNINLTYIILIPKNDNPTSISQFRPISLCKVIYKILAKCITNMLK